MYLRLKKINKNGIQTATPTIWSVVEVVLSRERFEAIVRRVELVTASE
jgi:hypothetical protein